MSGQMHISRVIGSSAFRTFAAALVCSAVPFAAQAQPLPAGEGQAAVEAVCTSCHQTNMIHRSSGYTAAHWDELIATMDLSARQARLVAQFRSVHGPFATPEDIAQVAGITDEQVIGWEEAGMVLTSRAWE